MAPKGRPHEAFQLSAAFGGIRAAHLGVPLDLGLGAWIEGVV